MTFGKKGIMKYEFWGDATCSDTFSESYRSQATGGAGCVVALAEVWKQAKYSFLPTTLEHLA